MQISTNFSKFRLPDASSGMYILVYAVSTCEFMVFQVIKILIVKTVFKYGFQEPSTVLLNKFFDILPELIRLYNHRTNRWFPKFIFSDKRIQVRDLQYIYSRVNRTWTFLENLIILGGAYPMKNSIYCIRYAPYRAYLTVLFQIGYTSNHALLTITWFMWH